MSDPKKPEKIIVYGSSISYFTGKLENYFRVKGIPYQFKPVTQLDIAPLMRKKLGTSQMPAILLPDGQWMTDTTPIIQWFEENCELPAITPSDPVQRFFSLLLEDYADEWLWRPAMHYRWYYNRGARFASTHLAEELASDLPVPQAILRWRIIRRQRNGYTTGDGISKGQVKGVEAIFRRTLQQLESIFTERPFMLGDTPSLADIGFSGPIFRHFGLDPVPAEIMRTFAPNTYEWAARLWNYRLSDSGQSLDSGIPDKWGAMMQEIGSNYLPYLNANVNAVKEGKKRFNTNIDGVRYTGARWSMYRVWCLQKLRDHFNNLDDDSQIKAKLLLSKYDCWAPLWQESELPLSSDVCSNLPFYADTKMIDVYD